MKKKPYMEFFGAWWLVGAAMLFNSVFGVYRRQGIPMTPKNCRVLAYSLNMNFVDEMLRVLPFGLCLSCITKMGHLVWMLVIVPLP